MPVKQRRTKRRGPTVEACSPQFWELTLGRCDAPHRQGFATRAEAREAWFANRDMLMASNFGGGRPGCRPAAFWDY